MKLLKTQREKIYIDSESVWHESLRRAGVTVNVDASWVMKEDNDPKNKVHSYKRIQQEGQGPKVVSDMYNIMNAHPDKFFDFIVKQLAVEGKNALFNEVKLTGFTIGYIVRPDDQLKSNPYLSGDDYHPLATLILEDGTCVTFAILTSTNDEGTYQFADFQYINENTKDYTKGQYLRPLSYLLCFDAKEVCFTKLSQHTSSVRDDLYNDKKIKDIFIETIASVQHKWSNNSIRSPISFTVERMNKLAIFSCEDRLAKCEKLHKELKQQLKWDNLSEEDKKRESKKRSLLHDNEIIAKRKSAFVKLLSKKDPQAQILFKSKEKLLKEKARYEKKISSKEEIDHNGKTKPTINRNANN